MAVGGPNILIPGISDEAWEALKETAIESLSNLVQTELFPRLFEKSFFGGSALGALAGTAIRSLGTYLNNEDVSFTEALNQSARFSLQTLSYIATGTSTSKLVNLLFRNKGLALATSRLFGRYSELVFREVGTNLLSNPLAQTLGHFIGLPSLPFSLKDGAYFAVSGSLGAIREAHIARGWAGIVAEGVHRIADTWVQNSMNGRITSGLDLIRATSSSFQKMMGGSLKVLGLSQRPEHTNIPQPVVDAWNHPVTRQVRRGARATTSALAAACGLPIGVVYSQPPDVHVITQKLNNSVPIIKAKRPGYESYHDNDGFFRWLEGIHLGEHFNHEGSVGKTFTLSYQQSRYNVSDLQIIEGNRVQGGHIGISFCIVGNGKIKITNISGSDESERAAIALGKNSHHDWEPNETWEKACLLTMEDTLFEAWQSQKVNGGRSPLPPGTVYTGLASKENFDRVKKLPILRHQAEKKPPEPLKCELYFSRVLGKDKHEEGTPAPLGRFAIRKPEEKLPDSGISIKLEIIGTNDGAELIPTCVRSGRLISDWHTKKAIGLNEAFAWERLVKTHPVFHRELACVALDDVLLDSQFSTSKVGWGPAEINKLRSTLNNQKSYSSFNKRGIFIHHPDQTLTVHLSGYHEGGLCNLEGFSPKIEPREQKRRVIPFTVSVVLTKDPKNQIKFVEIQDPGKVLTVISSKHTVEDLRLEIIRGLQKVYGKIELPPEGYVIGEGPQAYTLTKSALTKLQPDKLTAISRSEETLMVIACPLYHALEAGGHSQEAQDLRKTLNSFCGWTIQRDGRTGLGLDLSWDYPSINALKRVANNQTPGEKILFLSNWFEETYGRIPRQGEKIYIRGLKHHGANWADGRIPEGFLEILDVDDFKKLPPSKKGNRNPVLIINRSGDTFYLEACPGTGGTHYATVFRENGWISSLEQPAADVSLKRTAHYPHLSKKYANTKAIPLNEVFDLPENQMPSHHLAKIASNRGLFEETFESACTVLTERGNDCNEGILIFGQLRNDNIVSLTCRPASQKPPKAGREISLVARKINGIWTITDIKGAHLSKIKAEIILGDSAYSSSIEPGLVADCLTHGLRGKETLQTAGYKLLYDHEVAKYLNRGRLSQAWAEIQKARPHLCTFDDQKPLGVLIITKQRADKYQLGICALGDIPEGDHVQAIPLYPQGAKLAYKKPLPKGLPEKFRNALETNSTILEIKEEPAVVVAPLPSKRKPQSKPRGNPPSQPVKEKKTEPAISTSHEVKKPDLPSTKPSSADDHVNQTTPPPSPTALRDQDDLSARSQALASNLPPQDQLGAKRLSDRLGNWRKGVETRSPTYQHASTSLGKIENFAGAQRLAHDLTNPGLGSSDRVAMIADRLPPLLDRLFGPIKNHPDFSSEEPEIRDLFGKALEKPARFLIIFEETEHHVALATANQRTNEDAVSEALVRITGTLERETQDAHVNTKIGKRKK